VTRRRTQPRPPSKHAPLGWERADSLSITEAAAVIGISRSRAYAWVEDGRLTVVTDHLGEHRVKPATLKAFLRRRQGEQIDLFSGSAP
jgi:excisionase family DNA binding protein